jgi:hypothetical protein
MIRRITAVGVAAIAAASLAGVATAASGHAAKVFKASLGPVNPDATTAGVADVRGRAQLVDGKNNKVSLHMRGLAPRTMYLWHVHEGSCAATGAPIPGFIYRTHDAMGDGTLTTNAAGNANTKGKSATFNADPAKSYSVNVHVAAPTNGLAAGTIIACGDLKASKAIGKSKARTKKPRPPHPPQAKGPKP